MSRKKCVSNIVVLVFVLFPLISLGVDQRVAPKTSAKTTTGLTVEKDLLLQSDTGKIAESSSYFAPTVIGNSFFVTEGRRFINLSGADIAVQPDYVLKVGDVLVIDVWGDLDLHYSLTVDKDGAIVVPNAGRVDLLGLAFEQGKKKILNKLADTYEFYIDRKNPGAGKAHLDISLGKISGVKVYITGEVIHPGSVILNGANSSIIAAIASGGGLTNKGSVRNIQITHTDKTQSVFDLYAFLFKGEIAPENKYLKDGDIVYVPPIRARAYCLGAVVNPGTYEVRTEETLSTLIDISGGFTSFASGKVTVSSAKEDINYKQNINEQVKEVVASSIVDYKVKDNDIIIAKEDLKPKPYSYVEIAGRGARYNGKLRYEQGLTVNDYINRAGGLYRDAYKTIFLKFKSEDGCSYIKNLDLGKYDNIAFVISPGSELIIEDAMTMYTKSFAYVYGCVQQAEILKLSGIERISDLIPKNTIKDNADLQNALFIHDGKKIIIDLTKIIDDIDVEQNIKLSQKDTLILSKLEPYIEVVGEVLTPGFYPYVENQTAKYYIDLAGGFIGASEKYKTVITNPAGHSIVGYFRWFDGEDPIVKRGSKISVPSKEKIKGLVTNE